MKATANLLLLLLLLPLAALSQKVTLLTSASQKWAGGVCCRHGVNYTFRLSFFALDPRPDTLWLGMQDIPLTISDSVGTNATRTRKKAGTEYLIQAQEVVDDRNGRQPAEPEQDPVLASLPPVDYKGVALLSYYNKGRRRFFVIDKIMHQLPQQDHP